MVIISCRRTWHKACGGSSLANATVSSISVSLLDMILVVIYMHPNVFPLLKFQNDVNCISKEIHKKRSVSWSYVGIEWFG